MDDISVNLSFAAHAPRTQITDRIALAYKANHFRKAPSYGADNWSHSFHALNVVSAEGKG